jgi:oxaloacetate decarboxylase alpha subunit
VIPWQSLHDIGQILEDGELDEIELENEDFSVRMSKKPSGTPAPVAAPSPGGGEAPSTTESTETSSSGGGGSDVPEDWVAIESPMVGTFYEAPAPAADPFVEVGDTVDYDTTVCIIEAMKLMNEIEAETEGVIKEVCKEDAEPVSKGDVLFYVEPS